MRHCVSEFVCGKVFYQSPAVSSGSLVDCYGTSIPSVVLCFCFFYISLYNSRSNSKSSVTCSAFGGGTRLNTRTCICPSPLSSGRLRLCLQNRQPSNKYIHPLFLLLNTHPTQAFPLSKSHKCTIPQSHASAKRNEE